MELKRFILKSLIMGILVGCTIAVYNYAFDFYSIFRPQPEKIRYSYGTFSLANLQFYKLQYIFAHPEREYSLLVGSSRAGFVDVSKIKKGEFYNFYYRLSYPELWIRDLKLLLDKKVKIKRIVMAIDEVSFMMDMKKQYSDWTVYPYPVTMPEKILCYIKLIFKVPKKDIFVKLRDFGTEHYRDFEFSENGTTYFNFAEKDLNADPDKHRASKLFTIPMKHANIAPRIRDTIAILKEYRDLCRRHNIEFALYINPTHPQVYCAYPIKIFNEFKRRLLDVGDYYDFSGINSISKDNFNFYETSHFRLFVGDKIIARVFNQSGETVPNDFGVLVTRDTIDAHLASCTRQAEQCKEVHAVEGK